MLGWLVGIGNAVVSHLETIHFLCFYDNSYHNNHAISFWSFVYIYERPILMGRLNLRLVQILILMEMHAFSVKIRAFSPNLHKMHAFPLKTRAFSPNLHKMRTFSRKCVHFMQIR